MLLTSGVATAQEQQGSISGVLYDKDFDAPIPKVRVEVLETGDFVETTAQGTFSIGPLPPDSYTLTMKREGYIRQVREVLVEAGRVKELGTIQMPAEFTDMEDFVVEDVLQLDEGSVGLELDIKFEAPQLVDSVGVDFMKQTGAGDAAEAVSRVAGASVQDGKAVIRGLPDRYVSSVMNGVRLPSADQDTRAVELDQFPTPVLQAVRVSKTFTPDLQGDGSGGQVGVVLRGIPEETSLNFSSQYSFNSAHTGKNKFLLYDEGGVSGLGSDTRDPQLENLGDNWEGAVGVNRRHAPVDSKWALSGGTAFDLDNGWRIGGFASVFYERDSSFYDDGRDDSYWVAQPGGPLEPETLQGTPSEGDFKTALLDVTRGSELVQWGSLGTFGLESERHKLGLTYLYTRTAEDSATLAEDTRGKEFYFPGYDPNDPTHPGNDPNNLQAAPYIRTETLQYEERTTRTLQLGGEHTLGDHEWDLGDAFTFTAPILSWKWSDSGADLYQPDKRQFGALWEASSENPGAPPFIPPFTTPATHFPFKPAANFNLGNLQRIWQEIEEDSSQYSIDLELPFTQWNEQEGYVKVGVFDDDVQRRYDQDSFSNFGDAGAFFEGEFGEYWSEVFPGEDHPITEGLTDVDYRGSQDLSATYVMLNLPLAEDLDLVTGVRFESTQIGIINDPEEEAVWFPGGATAPVALNPGDADVTFEQDDELPSFGLIYEATEEVTLRAAYSQTIARQTFKELSPILQQEFLGGPVFIGNPELGMSSLQNYDLRFDWVPQEGSLVSVSWFQKKITDPIEYIQRLAGFTFTTPVNYPEGELSGFEVEVRQELGAYNDKLEGLTIGGNAAWIDSEVQLSPEEIALFADPTIGAPLTSREMTNAPDQLYNFFLTYDFPNENTRAAIFYSISGDTLLNGAGVSQGNLIPSVYARPFDTLNVSLSHQFTDYFTARLQIKNLTNDAIETVYRSQYIGQDVTNTSFTRGVEYSLSLSFQF